MRAKKVLAELLKITSYTMSNETLTNDTTTQKPKWIRVKLPTGKNYRELRTLVDKYKLNTICQSGSCPNMGECWGEGQQRL